MKKAPQKLYGFPSDFDGNFKYLLIYSVIMLSVAGSGFSGKPRATTGTISKSRSLSFRSYHRVFGRISGFFAALSLFAEILSNHPVNIVGLSVFSAD